MSGRGRVRRIRPDEADALREIRLRALADTPLAFGSTEAREAVYPPERWEQWARDSAAGGEQTTFFALGAGGAEAGAAADGARPAGLAYARIDEDDRATAHLFSMWVAPEARGSGAASALVDAVVDWTAANGARTLRTAVTIGNEGAARLYARAGFTDTGEREPLGHSGAEVALLERTLPPPEDVRSDR
jgi:ribosomal protein S18 acetylase RimI-like enzyme